MTVKGLSITMLFEASAVNRDEKLAGNIMSIKKLSRYNGIYSFMSRAFLRHHLFETLQRLYGWEGAPVTTAQDVIQFAFPEANIISYPEMDVFGFMNTSVLDTGVGIMRKAPLGMTKAISLEPWQADMAFYANHDLVQRGVAAGVETVPNPFQKEEHHSYYRMTFTLDLCRLGYHDIHLVKLPEELKEWLEALPEASAEDLAGIKFFGDDGVEDGVWYSIGKEEVRGVVGVRNNKTGVRITFIVSPEQRKVRIKQLLEAVTNGLMIHSSTENYGAVPVFFVVGALRAPVPIFNSYVTLKNSAVNTGVLERALENDYIEKAWLYEGAITLDKKIKLGEWQGVEEVLKLID
ncbi:MAG: type I-B CRISPR-associated protein Cas7/Cst2/DevR [bacterium]|jgi:CRISPR-associated protein Cst2